MRKNSQAISRPTLPAPGARVGVVCGPGEFPADAPGTVLCHVETRFGAHALVLMDSGEIRTCHGMNRGPGIGWHALETRTA